MNQALGTLQTIREFAGPRQTVGLNDATIERFVDLDPSLADAIADAGRIHEALQAEYGELLSGDESEAAAFLQTDFVNFYPANTVNPYISMAAAGPWIVTSHGAVLHDNGGYGMLGAGHSPRATLLLGAGYRTRAA